MEITESINSRFIKCLLRIPFPYSHILQEQIEASIYTNTIFSGYFCIHFTPSETVNSLPHWLDAMPLSWQILTDSAPLLCQLFIKEGYIEKLEMIDLALNNIEWEKVWISEPLLDYEYDIWHVVNHLTDKQIIIRKVVHVGLSIDLVLELGNRHFVASFRECQVRKLKSEDLPFQCLLNICDHKMENYRFTVSSSNGLVDFDCASIFIQWHKMIG